MRITKETLEKWNAYSSTILLFESAFPDGVDLTPESFDSLVSVGFNVEWIARNILGRSELEVCDSAVESLWDQCAEAIAPHQRSFDAISKAYRDTCEQIVVSTWKKALFPS